MQEVQCARAFQVEVRPAFSALGGEVKYVQHRLWQDRADVIDLFRQGARVFVCGDAQRLLPSVRETAARIYQEATGCTPDQAAQWLADLEQNAESQSVLRGRLR